jgi:predicted porin
MKLTKTLLAAAVGAASCGLAHAEVVVYGMAMPFLESVESKNATFPAPAAADRPSMVPASAYTGLNDARRNRITVGTSQLGFRGSEDLGAGLKAVWQLESGFQIDQNTGPGLGARDSKLGLQNEWGEIFLGQWDTPYKYISLPVNPLRAGYVFDRTAITGNPGFGVPNTTTQFTRIGAKPDASFDRRAGNSVQYWSPKLGGLTFRVGYSVDEGKGPVTPTGPTVSPTIFAASVSYDVGTLSLRYAYEQHNDYFGMSQIGGSAAGTAANSSSKDRGHKFVVLYRIGNTRLTGLVEQLEYRNDDSIAGAVKGYKRTAWYGVIEQFFANNSSVWISYGRAADGSCTRVGGAACSTHAIGADYMTLGYIYRFSKRTEVFAAYYRMNNKENGTYSPGPFIALAPAPGADTQAAGVGIIHFF